MNVCANSRPRFITPWATLGEYHYTQADVGWIWVAIIVVVALLAQFTAALGKPAAANSYNAATLFLMAFHLVLPFFSGVVFRKVGDDGDSAGVKGALLNSLLHILVFGIIARFIARVLAIQALAGGNAADYDVAAISDVPVLFLEGWLVFRELHWCAGRDDSGSGVRL